MQSGVILLVEDDQMLQMVTKRSIEYLGYACEVVGSAEEAIARSSDDLLLIFMDIRLPGIQGEEAATLIRAAESQGLRKRVPIVSLTGHAVRERCLEAGMDDFLSKPVMINEYKRVIEKWLSHKAGEN